MCVINERGWVITFGKEVHVQVYKLKGMTSFSWFSEYCSPVNESIAITSSTTCQLISLFLFDLKPETDIITPDIPGNLTTLPDIISWDTVL